MNRVALALAVIAFPLALSAQWPDYPASGAKPSLDAKTPRAADGHPDLTGVWENIGDYIGRPPRGFPEFEPVNDGQSPPIPPARPCPGGPPKATFFNIGGGFKDGMLPLKPWAADLLKKR